MFCYSYFYLDPTQTFRPRQAQQSYRARFQANNNNQQQQQQQSQFQSYNNVPPPSSLTQPKPQPSGIRFQLNTRPQTTPNKPGRRTRFSSPPKQSMTPDNHSNDMQMDTTNPNESRGMMTAIEAFKLACDKQNWPDSLK